MTLPDTEYETHTVVIDNLSHGNNTNFVAFLPNPLENVVEAKLMAASLNTNGDAQRCIHITINELRSTFSQTARADLSAASSNIESVFGTIMCQHQLHGGSNGQKAVFFRDDYDIEQQFITPILKLDRLTFDLDKQNGTPASVQDAVFVMRFTCMKRNMKPF